MLHLGFVKVTGKTTVDSEARTNLTVSNYDQKSSARHAFILQWKRSTAVIA